ncbi:hypothetical protein FQR65_LT03493 [Abscondita terminalis]|nr:hypothetical protein FQR65_LT03493 [Abscondita terminalis]
MNITDLYIAASEGDYEAVRNILTVDASNVNSYDQGRTALHAAASGGTEAHLKVIEVLVAHGANVNLTDDRQQTPLHAAASSGNIDAVKFLISKGVGVNAKDNAKQTPLHIAAQQKHCKEKNSKDQIKLALKSMETFLKGYSMYVPCFGEDFLRLTKNALESEISDEALLLAVYYNNFGVVIVLVDAGADINARDDRNQTVLDRATRTGHGAVVKFLVGKGAV